MGFAPSRLGRLAAARPLFAIAVGLAVLAWSPLDAAVRPPKLQYQISTLPNGLRVILS